MALHRDFEHPNPQPLLKGSVTFKAGAYPALQTALRNAMDSHGVKFGTALKVIGTIGADAWQALTFEEQAKALGLRPY